MLDWTQRGCLLQKRRTAEEIYIELTSGWRFRPLLQGVTFPGTFQYHMSHYLLRTKKSIGSDADGLCSDGYEYTTIAAVADADERYLVVR